MNLFDLSQMCPPCHAAAQRLACERLSTAEERRVIESMCKPCLKKWAES